MISSRSDPLEDRGDGRRARVSRRSGCFGGDGRDDVFCGSDGEGERVGGGSVGAGESVEARAGAREER